MMLNYTDQLLGTVNVGYVVTAVRPINDREALVRAEQMHGDKAVTWCAFRINPDSEHWTFAFGHYFDTPGNRKGNIARATANLWAR